MTGLARISIVPRSVLVVDDDPRVGAALAGILKLDGRDVTVLVDARQALPTMRLRPPDLLLLDLRMPFVDGLTVLREMRADEAIAETPVVLITGSYDDEAIAECLELGVLDLICKPFHRTETRLRINAQLKVISANRRTRIANQELRAISDAAQEAIVVLDHQGLIAHWNPAAERLFGYPRAEALGRDLHDLVTPERYRLGQRVAFEQFRDSGEGAALGRTMEVTARRKDGAEIPIELSLSATRVDGRWGSVGIARDITERRRVEAELKLLHTAVDQSPASVVITDTTGSIEYVNKKFCEVTGYTAEEVRGQNPRVLKSGSTPTGTYAQLWSTIATGGTWSGQFCNRRKDGSEYWEQVSISPVRGDGGMPTHFIALKEDITAQRALEVQLRQSQKLEAVGQLAAGIAHEINTPTQFVSDSVHFLEEALTDLLALVRTYQEIVEPLVLSADVRDGLAEAERAADLPYLQEHGPKAITLSIEGLERIARIVRAMKEFSHPDQGDMTQVDLNAALQNTLVIANNELKYVADVECQFGDVPAVHCLAGELNQVFLILIVNAAHAIGEVVGTSGDRGRIRVTTRTSEGGVEISVSDTGGGIPESVRHRIFEPFFTTKPVGKGTGQGLAIARSIVMKKHGGRLSFESNVGQGTTFTVWLPAEDAGGAA